MSAESDSGAVQRPVDEAPSLVCPFLILGDTNASECVANGHCGCGMAGEFPEDIDSKLRRLLGIAETQRSSHANESDEKEQP